VKVLFLCFYLTTIQAQISPQTDHAHSGSDRTQISSPTVIDSKSPSGQTRTNSSNAITNIGKPDHVIMDNLPSKDLWDKLSVGSTIALVVVGIGTLICMGAQTKIAANAALSAKATVDGLVNGDRAWILIDHFKEWTFETTNDHHGAHCAFMLKNFGKTPAILTGYRAELQLGSNERRPSDERIYNSPQQNFVSSVVPQNEELPQIAYLKGQIKTIGEQEMDQIDAKTLFLWLCVAVEYRDVFKPEQIHALRFCYRLDPDFPGGPIFRIAGPQEFNSWT